MADKIEIREQDNRIVQTILSSILPENATVLVFGSRVTGQVKRSSDLDLAIDAGRPLTREEDLALVDAFEESDLPYTVDIVDLNRASDRMRDIIRQSGKPFWQK